MRYAVTCAASTASPPRPSILSSWSASGGPPPRATCAPELAFLPRSNACAANAALSITATPCCARCEQPAPFNAIIGSPTRHCSSSSRSWPSAATFARSRLRLDHRFERFVPQQGPEVVASRQKPRRGARVFRSWTRQRIRELLFDAAGSRGHHDDAVRQENGLVDGV